MKFLHFEYKKDNVDYCTLVLVKSNGVVNQPCAWERVGDTLLILREQNTNINPELLALPMPVPDCINSQYVLTLRDDTANGVAKSQNPRGKGEKEPN